jgi:hypothetical protein|tara:strand:- start:82173 stop:82571 length:399 start_codon:yes stop_codon:yes gene_type:complete
MNTKLLMTLSAVLLGALGMTLSFLPEEIMTYLNVESNPITILLLQLLSAFYLGFGILNWMAKGTIIGGIYNRPIAIGNLMHFGVGAIALIKIIARIQIGSEAIIILTVSYVILALCFAYVFFNNPSKVSDEK